MLLIRPLQDSDLDDLYAMAGNAGNGLTTLPADRELLQSKIHRARDSFGQRSEEHASELQSRPHPVCRLPLEQKRIISGRQLAINAHMLLRKAIPIDHHLRVVAVAMNGMETTTIVLKLP